MEVGMRRRWTFGALLAVVVGIVTALSVSSQQHAERQATIEAQS
jgi:predicted outer membrane lipoprotein